MKHLLFAFVVILLSSCNKSIDHNLLIKRVDFDKKTSIEKANLILQNKIFVWDLWEPVDYQQQISWDINPYQNDSWVLYFHSLRMVGILARAYEFEKDKIYIEKAIEILRSWNHYNKTNLENIYTDHMVANRILNLSHLYFVAPTELNIGDKELIENIIFEHGEWLYNDKNYTLGNHAIMQDRALMQAALTFPNFKTEDRQISNDWYNKALERAIKTFDNEISEEGVCVENSPGYHPYVMDLLKDFITMGENFDRPFPEKYNSQYEKMKDFLVYIIKPNNLFPSLGDTYFLNSPLHFSDKYENENLLYVDSKGKMGIKPPFVDKIYKKSGYAIFREYWQEGVEYGKEVQLTFINTNQSYVHKHSDYLSFELFSNGEDILVDGGHIGYNKDSITAYLRSTQAHNTVAIDNTNYDYYKVPLNTGANITDYESNIRYAFVKAYFSPDLNTNFKRKIIYIKPNAFIIVDKLILANQEDQNLFQQTFNFGKEQKNIYEVSKKHLRVMTVLEGK